MEDNTNLNDTVGDGEGETDIVLEAGDREEDSDDETSRGRPVAVASGGGDDATIETKWSFEPKAAPADPLVEMRTKHQQRADKFGVPLVEPRRSKLSRREILDMRNQNTEGFQTGFDIYSDDQMKKREERAKRFAANLEAASAARASQETAANNQQVTEQLTEEDKQRLLARQAKFGVVKPVQPKTSQRRFIIGGKLLTEQDIARMKEREAKFGPVQVNDGQPRRQLPELPSLSERGHLLVKCKDRKLEWDQDVPRRHEAIYLYGTDDMDTKALLSYFDGYGPKSVEWVNLSSAVIVFEDAFTAKRALFGVSGGPSQNSQKDAAESVSDGNGTGTAGLTDQGAATDASTAAGADDQVAKSQDGDDAMADDQDEGPGPAAIDPLLAWYTGPPFIKGNRETKIELRIATIDDLKPPDATPWRGGRAAVRGGSRRRRSGGKRSRNSDHMDIDYGLGAGNDTGAADSQKDAQRQHQIVADEEPLSEEELERRRKRRERFSAFLS